MENHANAPGGEPEQEKPKLLLTLVLIWLGVLCLPWLLIAAIIAISVTPADETLLWSSLGPFPPVVALSIVFLFAGFQRSRRGWMVMAAVASTIAAFLPWAGAFFIDTSIS